MKPILIIAEIFQGSIQPVTYELVSAACEILNGTTPLKGKKTEPTGRIIIIVPADSPKTLADTLSKKTGMGVIGLKIPGLKVYSADAYITCLHMLIQELRPSHILVAHTAQGRDFAPGLALRSNAASVPGVIGIRAEDQGLSYVRSVQNNTKHMILRPKPAWPVVLTLNPGSFKPFKRHGHGQETVEIREIITSDDTVIRIRQLKMKQKASDNKALKAAKVIVAAGRGIGDQENLEWIFKFSTCFTNSAVGVSRPLVDMGWIGYEHQVGITGATVSPDVYIACGISGSSQHLAGMMTAGTVICINKNPNAPMRRHSDLYITEDVLEFIQAFMEL